MWLYLNGHTIANNRSKDIAHTIIAEEVNKRAVVAESFGVVIGKVRDIPNHHCWIHQKNSSPVRESQTSNKPIEGSLFMRFDCLY